VTSSPARPFRFAVGAPSEVPTRQDLVRHARFVESAGFAVATFPDHFFLPLAPLIAMTVVAEVTSRLRIGTLMLAAGFRNPALLAKELATVDLLTEGRLEVGLGAGWMESEHVESGSPFGSPAERVDRAGEVASVLKAAWTSSQLSYRGTYYQYRDLPSGPAPVQTGGPPLLMGGGRRRVLTAAGEVADVVTIAPGAIGAPDGEVFGHADRLNERLGWVRAAAAARGRDPELHLLLSGVVVCKDRYAGARRCVDLLNQGGFFQSRGDDVERSILESPYFAIGTEDEICDQLIAVRRTFGISYFSVRESVAKEFAPIVAELSGH
jgi:probable F420-dependent oxidoreductase